MAKIFITDDSPFIRELISALVEETGHIFETAASGEELLRRYNEVKPDIVILDIVMIGMNGLDTLDKLIALDRNAKVLICSAFATQIDIEKEALGRGAYAVLPKPISLQELKEKIEEGLKI
ncbi:MAG: response regulator [Selenomonadaceae bacterium]|nr:response regulator [Selenomonadaceae bacterium]